MKMSEIIPAPVIVNLALGPDGDPVWQIENDGGHIFGELFWASPNAECEVREEAYAIARAINLFDRLVECLVDQIEGAEHLGMDCDVERDLLREAMAPIPKMGVMIRPSLYDNNGNQKTN